MKLKLIIKRKIKYGKWKKKHSIQACTQVGWTTKPVKDECDHQSNFLKEKTARGCKNDEHIDVWTWFRIT